MKGFATKKVTDLFTNQFLTGRNRPADNHIFIVIDKIKKQACFAFAYNANRPENQGISCLLRCFIQ
jgi:hypothetical protein